MSVRFDITNARDLPVSVLTEGQTCEPARIARLPETTGLLLRCGRDCFDFCTFSSDIPETYSLTRLDAGASLSIDLGGVEVKSYTTGYVLETSVCPCTEYASVRAAPGRYRASFVVETDLESTRVQNCGDGPTCVRGNGFTIAVGLSCLASDTAAPLVSVDFELPESGELVVPVVIE